MHFLKKKLWLTNVAGGGCMCQGHIYIIQGEPYGLVVQLNGIFFFLFANVFDTIILVRFSVLRPN